jgi:hypothetical protein
MDSTSSTCGIETNWSTWQSYSNLLTKWSCSISKLVGTKWMFVCDGWFWKLTDVIIGVDALVLGRL